MRGNRWKEKGKIRGREKSSRRKGKRTENILTRKVI